MPRSLHLMPTSQQLLLFITKKSMLLFAGSPNLVHEILKGIIESTKFIACKLCAPRKSHLSEGNSNKMYSSECKTYWVRKEFLSKIIKQN